MKNILCLLLLVSCAHKINRDGGQANYEPVVFESLGPQELPTYAQTVVARETRDPDGPKLSDFRKTPAGEIRRVGLVVFETQFQPTRSGLATDRNVYLSARGKQILTEQMWEHWLQELRRLSGSALTWVSRADLMKSKAFASGGFPQPDYILKHRDELSEADVFWRDPGQKIPEESLLQPARYRDVGLLLVPAIELLGGAKPSQHQHHWINDMAKEMNLDAVVVVYLSAEWRRGSVDKRTHEVIPEEMKMLTQAAVLYPWGSYHEVGATLGKNNLPKLNVPLGSYSAKSNLPVKITLTKEAETLDAAMTNVIAPLKTHITRLSNLMIERMLTDIRQTHQPVRE